MEYIRTLRDLMEVSEVEPILGMEKYKLGQGLNQKQAFEIKELIACAAGVNLNNIRLDSELPVWGNPYWFFTEMYLMVIGGWGPIGDDYYDGAMKKLWNALNIQEKQMAAVSMGVLLKRDIYKYKWTQ